MTTDCLDDDRLLRLVERSVPAAELDHVREHLDSCESCSSALLALVRGAHPTGGEAIAEFPANTRVGRFTLEELLGSGNMGTVFIARDPQLGRAVALKLLRAGRTGEQPTAHLLREAKAMAQVRHPNVVTVYEVGQDEDVIFVAMEQIRGPTLRAAVAARRPASAVVLGWLVQVARGLAAVHAANLVHRDLKPDNIFVEDGGGGQRVVVGDLGLAVASADPDGRGEPAIDPSTSATRSAGTPAYMAPEQLRGDPLDRRADVFAFGVTAWEILTGRRPFEGRTAGALDDAIRRGPPELASTAIPRRVARMLARCIAYDRDDRPGSIADVLAVLESRPRSRRWFGVVAAAIAVSCGVVIVASRSDDSPGPACDPDATPTWEIARATWPTHAGSLSPFVRDAIVATMDRRSHAWRDEAAAACRRDALVQQAWRSCRRRLEIQEDRLLELAVLRRWPDDQPLPAVFARLDPPAYCASKLAAEDAVAISSLRSEMASAIVDIGLADLVRASAFAELDAAADRDTALAEAAQLAAGIRPSPLDGELALATATLRPLAQAKAQVAALEAATADAERGGRASLVARAWLSLAEQAGPLELDAATIDQATRQADWAITRLGDPSVLRVRWLAVAGSTAWTRGDHAGAKQRFAAASALAKNDPALALTHTLAIAKLATVSGDDHQAAAIYREILADRDVTSHMPASDQVVLQSSLAESLYRLGDLTEAKVAGDRARSIARDALAADDPSRLMTELSQSSILLDLGDAPGSLAVIDAAIPLIVTSLGSTHRTLAQAHTRRAQTLLALRRPDDAARAVTEAIRILDSRFGRRNEESVAARAILAETYEASGQIAKASPTLDEALQDAESVYGRAHPMWAQIAVVAAEARVRTRPEDAAPAQALLEQAIPILAAAGAPEMTARGKFQLAKLVDRSDHTRALELARSAEAILAKEPRGAEIHANVVRWLRDHGGG